MSAETVTLRPIADTTLIETTPSNNLGGATFVNSGTTQNGTLNRGLFKFDPQAQIPHGSKIKTADLILEVTGQPKDGFSPAAFGLHRLFQPWGEGDKIGITTAPGLGAPATTNEATWSHRFAFTTNVWTTPGGRPTNDFSPLVSVEQFVYGISDSPYTFGSTPQMVADVQSWLDNPQTNFGWLLKGVDEAERFTARRFGSREEPDRAPLLLIEFTAPPRIEGAQIEGNKFKVWFSAEADRAYVVQFRDLLTTGAWSTLTNIIAQPATTNIVVFDPKMTDQRFYRVGAQ